MSDIFILLCAGTLALLLGVAAWGDIASRTIPNALTGGIALLAPLWWLANGIDPWPGMAIQFALALGVFTVFAAVFALGMMGGGDVKLLAALALWFAPLKMADLVVIMAIAGGVLTVAMVILHRVRRAEGRPEVPYGVAIAGAALWIIANPLLTNSPA